MPQPADAWARLLDLNADLLLNATDQVTPEQASQALTPGGNTIAFLVAHLVDSRHFAATLLDAPLPNPLSASLDKARSIAEVRDLPPLPELRAAWVAISRHLGRALAMVDAAKLAGPASQRFPGSDGTLNGTLGFLVQHDSYHLGQVAMLRRQVGLPPMSYTRGAMDAAGSA